VISVCIEKTEDQEDNHLRYSSSGEVEESHHNHQKQISKHQKESPTSPSLCNHHSSSANVASPTTATTTTTSSTTKRKIPKSEDSPLISSTRDDLGEHRHIPFLSVFLCSSCSLVENNKMMMYFIARWGFYLYKAYMYICDCQQWR